jgi:hypothetical protein
MTNHDRINNVCNVLKYVMYPYFEAKYSDIAYIAYEVRCLVWEGGKDTLARELIEGLVAVSVDVIYKLWSMYDKIEAETVTGVYFSIILINGEYYRDTNLKRLGDSICYLHESIQELKEEYGIP